MNNHYQIILDEIVDPLSLTMVLYSKEQPMPYQGKIGSISYVPSVAGLLLTSYVINQILEK